MSADHTKKTDKRKWLKCYACKERKASTLLQEDPYSAEINDDHSKVQICDDCWQESADSI